MLFGMLPVEQSEVFPPPAPNGIEFPRDFKDWRLVSTTDRIDTNTLKVILGNEVAMRAIAERKMNPWPDGTVLAKVSLEKKPGGAGKFEQVGFMIKDQKRYASTAGWGWAQWNGLELKPFGRDANFPKDCVACHAPLRENDYVFSEPLGGPLPFDPLKWRVITTGVDTENGTTFTAFGNDAAIEHARSSATSEYPDGSSIVLVVWRQREHPRWFGAKVAAQPVSVELVEVGKSSAIYRVYQGLPLTELKATGSQTEQRLPYIVSLRAAVMP